MNDEQILFLITVRYSSGDLDDKSIHPTNDRSIHHTNDRSVPTIDAKVKRNYGLGGFSFAGDKSVWLTGLSKAAAKWSRFSSGGFVPYSSRTSGKLHRRRRRDFGCRVSHAPAMRTR